MDRPYTVASLADRWGCSTDAVYALIRARRLPALDLTWDRVDFERGTIDLRKSIQINALTKRAQKGRAIVPMGNEVRAALQDAKAGALTGHVIEWDGEPVKCVLKGFKAAATAAGLTGPVLSRHRRLLWFTLHPPQQCKNSRPTF